MSQALVAAPVLASFLLEAAFGYPKRLERVLPHPVAALGRAIGALEQRWNRATWPAALRRVLGAMTLLLVTGAAAAMGFAIEWLAGDGSWGLLLLAVAGLPGLATRSLFDHVADIATPLSRGDLPAARLAVARIVGRDTDDMDENAVAAASLESLAESFNDGVAAPLFWFLLCGLPGLYAYKAVNTADSMIGHREERWRAFGWAAARTDDLLNLVPARLAGALLAVAAFAPATLRGLRVMWRDARRHASPNSGWPEAAMAGVLGVQLGGAVRYDGIVAARAELGEGPAPQAKDLRRGMVLYLRAAALLAAALLLDAVLGAPV